MRRSPSTPHPPPLWRPLQCPSPARMYHALISGGRQAPGPSKSYTPMSRTGMSGIYGNGRWTAPGSVTNQPDRLLFDIDASGNISLVTSGLPTVWYINTTLVGTAASVQPQLLLKSQFDYYVGASQRYVAVKGCADQATGDLLLNVSGRTNALICDGRFFISSSTGSDVGGTCTRANLKMVAPWWCLSLVTGGQEAGYEDCVEKICNHVIRHLDTCVLMKGKSSNYWVKVVRHYHISIQPPPTAGTWLSHRGLFHLIIWIMTSLDSKAEIWSENPKCPRAFPNISLSRPGNLSINSTPCRTVWERTHSSVSWNSHSTPLQSEPTQNSPVNPIDIILSLNGDARTLIHFLPWRYPLRLFEICRPIRPSTRVEHHANLIRPKVSLNPRPGTCKRQNCGIVRCIFVENPKPVVAFTAAAAVSSESRTTSWAAEGGVWLAGEVVDAACRGGENLSSRQSTAVDGQVAFGVWHGECVVPD